MLGNKFWQYNIGASSRNDSRNVRFRHFEKISWCWIISYFFVVVSKHQDTILYILTLWPQKVTSILFLLTITLLIIHYDHENKGKELWLLSKFSMSSPKEMYTEEYGECGYCCQSVNPLTPKTWLLILSFSCYTFPCKLVRRVWCSIRIILCTW